MKLNYSDKYKSPTFIIIAAFLVLSLGLAGMAIRQNPMPDRQKIPEKSQYGLDDDPGSNSTIVYGSVGEKANLFSAINDSSKNVTPITTAKIDIKFAISLKDGRHFFYIAGTDSGDMGSSFVLKTIVPEGESKEGAEKIVYEAKDGFKIDRYFLSEDQSWIVWYELKPDVEGEYKHATDTYRVFKAPLKDVLDTGSRLVGAKISEQKGSPTTLIYLPALITNEGRVYFDSITGAYALHKGLYDEGFNVIIPENQYNSHPYLFKQRYLLYTSFEPNNLTLPGGNDTSARKEVLNTNILKTYDLLTRQIVTVAPGDDGEHYKHPVFIEGDPPGSISTVSEVYKIGTSDGADKLVFAEIQKTTRNSDGSFAKSTIVSKPLSPLRILGIGKLPGGDSTVLLGEQIEFTGNLGTGNGIGPSGYKNRLKSIYVYNLSTNSLHSTIKPDSVNEFEFISVMPKLSDEKIGIERNQKLVDEITDSDKQLKLGTFLPVEPRRERTNFRSECIDEWQSKGYPNYEACEACPIYVYSKKPMRVSIVPLRPIIESSTIPSILNNQWSFTANTKGELEFEDGVYSKIDYLFPRKKVVEPSNGRVFSKNNFIEGIRKYAFELGFISREVEDIVNFYKAELGDFEYILFSHLPQDSISGLLDFKIDPKPDTYESHVFYVKKITSFEGFNLAEPKFSKITRGDFSVIVWGNVFAN